MSTPKFSQGLRRSCDWILAFMSTLSRPHEVGKNILLDITASSIPMLLRRQGSPRICVIGVMRPPVTLWWPKFQPPTLVQTNYADTVYDASIFGLVYTSRGGEVITSGTAIQGRNPALMPEHGQAQSIRAVWEPGGGLGTRLGVTAWLLAWGT